MTKHKWHKEIIAWANGAKIQFKDANDENEWFDCVDNQIFWEIGDSMEYRIKSHSKDEALQMAIDYLHGSYEAHRVRKVCQEALEQPIARDWKETLDERIAKDYEFKQALERIIQQKLTDDEIRALDSLDFEAASKHLEVYCAIKQALKEHYENNHTR